MSNVTEIQTNTAIENAMSKILEYAQNPLGETRVITEEVMTIGKHIRQGDIYVERVADNVNKKGFDRTSNRQLAPGSNSGSRHTVSEAVEVFAPKDINVKQVDLGFKATGPILVSKDRFTVDHPEHASFSLPAGTYQVCYQVDPKTMQRVLD